MKENESGLNLVAIGGGTGLAMLLSGLKKYTGADYKSYKGLHIKDLTAVVTVTDDGGSSGRLRKELRVLPPGDIRNCLVALSEDESLMSELFQYRFSGNGHLHGHSFGNLFLSALSGVTGDFIQAIKVCSEVLAIKGKIYPSTIQDVRLAAELSNGRKVHGESIISKSSVPIRKLFLLPQHCKPVEGTLQAIREADIVTVGPGSLFTSLLPNLLIKRTVREIVRSKALTVYICNLMTQPGETTDFLASDHVKAIYNHTRAPIFDCVIANTKKVSEKLQEKYLKGGALQVKNDIRELKRLKLKVFTRDLVSEDNVVRHDPDLLAQTIFEAYLLLKSRRKSHSAGVRFKRGRTSVPS